MAQTLKELKEKVYLLEQLEWEIRNYEEFIDYYEARSKDTMYVTNDVKEYHIQIPLPEEFNQQILEAAKKQLARLKRRYEYNL